MDKYICPHCGNDKYFYYEVSVVARQNRKLLTGTTDKSESFFLISQKINIISAMFVSIANVISPCIFGSFAIFLIVLLILKVSGKNQLKQNGNRELR